MPKKEEYEIPDKAAVDEDFDSGMTTDEAIAKIGMILAESRDPMLLSEIDEHEIKACAALLVVAKKCGDHMLKEFVFNYLRLRVSKKRKGRSELLDIARSAKEVPEQRLSGLRKFFGFGRNGQ